MSDEDQKPAPLPSSETRSEPPKTDVGAASGGQNGGETVDKPNQADGVKWKKILPEAESREGEASVFQFRRLGEEPDGWWDAGELSSTVLQDIVDLDLGLIVVAHRTMTDASAITPRGAVRSTRRIARGLAATAHWSQVAAPNVPQGWDLPLQRAIENVIDETGEGRHVFGCAVDARTADDLRFFGVEHRAARIELDRWLKSRRANLIVHVALPPRHTRRRMANACPEFHWWSWWGWLDDLAEKVDFSFVELAALFRSVLGDPSDAQDTRDDTRERILHRNLRAWFSSAPDGAVDEIEFRHLLEQATANARAEADQGATAQDRVRRMFGLATSRADAATDGGIEATVEPIGTIERIVLTVWALLDRVDFVALMAVARGLLPEGEASSAQVPTDLRDAWERGAHDDRRLRRDTRPRADWRAVFDARRATLLGAAGLKCGDDLEVVERGTFEKKDVATVLAEWPESLETLVGRIRDRDLLHRLPRPAGVTLARMLATLRRLTPSLIAPADFVRFATGLEPAEGRMTVPRWVLDERRDRGVKWLADRIGPDFIHSLGDARIAVAAHRDTNSHVAELGDRVDDFEDELLIGTVGAFREQLEAFVGPGVEAGGLVDDCLDEIVDRAAEPSSALMVISHLVIGGPAPSDVRLGEATFRLVSDAVPDIEWPREGRPGQAFFETFDLHLIRTLNSVAPSGARSVDRWADAVALVAATPHARPWQKAVSSYMDDAIARHDIPWGNANRRPIDAPTVGPLFARQFLGPRGDDPSRIGPDLVERLFARSAEEHLVRLKDFARQGRETFFAALERRIVDLLSETYWVLSDEIDRREVDARDDVNARLSSEIWGGITETWGLDPVRGARDAAAAMLARIEARPGSRDRLPIGLLDLFAPTVLLHWRFRMFPPGPLAPDDNAAYVACLERLKTAAGARRGDAHRAFLALANAEGRLVDLFEANDCPRTAERHRDRRARILSLADFFSIARPPAARLVE